MDTSTEATRMINKRPATGSQARIGKTFASENAGPAAPPAGELSSNSTSQSPDDAVEVGNGVTRYDWSIAFTRICMRKEFSAISIALAMRLAEELPRKQGECNPRRDVMAAELGRDIRTIDRGYAEIEAAGFIRRRKGASKDATIITLLIPLEDADIHRFGNKTGVGTRDTRVSHMELIHTRHETGPHATQNGSTRDIQCVASKEQEVQEEQSAAPPRASGLVDIDGPVSPAADVKRDRAYGALADDPGYIPF